MKPSRLALLSAALAFAACESDVTSTPNPELQKQIETIQDCFPSLFAKGQDLLDLAELWRMNTPSAGSIPDPSGLSQNGTGPIDVTYTVNGCTFAMTIRFYDPNGNEGTGLPDTATALADKSDEAATDLRDSFPAGSFMVGDWTLTDATKGTGIAGSGALTGFIGGSTNSNELEELRTTLATPSGGPPTVSSSTITEGACTLTFETSSLVTDSFPAQEYPIGTIVVTIDGDDADTAIDVTAAVTFDNTAVVEIVIDGATSGRFLYNLETRVLTTAP